MTVATKRLLMLSGGPDSATLADFVAREWTARGQLRAIYLCSGHRADVKEIAAAEKIANRIGGPLEIVDIPDLLRALRGDRLMTLSKDSILPFNKAIALSLMMLCAISAHATALYVGHHRGDAADNEGYSRQAMDRLQALAAIGRSAAPKIIAPFLAMTKTEVVTLGAAMGVPYHLTWSCLRAEDLHCGLCQACRARRQAIADAGLDDPTRYEAESMAADRAGDASNAKAPNRPF